MTTFEIFELILRGVSVVLVLAAAFWMGWWAGYERGFEDMARRFRDSLKRKSAEKLKP